MGKWQWAAAGLAAALVLGANGASAQQQQYVGQWRCQIANQTVSNNRFENYIYEFTLGLQGNGSFQAQGTYFAETNGYSDPFQAQGTWQMLEGGITGNGQAWKQSGSVPFTFAFRYYGPGNMSYQHQSAYGRMAMACNR